MRLGLLASELLEPNRNKGLAGSVQLPAGRVLDAAATLREFPLVRTTGLEGAACWNDYYMLSSERILIELLRDACRHGAVALNYAPVFEVVIEGRSARGLRIRDRLSGQSYAIAARRIVNCAGPSLREFAQGRGGDAGRLFRPSLAFNLLLDLKLPANHALAVAAPRPDAPVLFLLPQAETLLAGTLHVSRPENTVEARPTEAEIERFLALLNEAVPALGASRDRVRRVFAGLLPAAEAGSADLARQATLFDHGALGGVQGLYSVSGVKFTTAGLVAREALALMGVAKGRDAISELPLSAATGLLTNARRLRSMEDSALGHELRRTVTEESVQCLDDLILRRSNWAVTDLELDQLRDRVARLVNLPASAL